MTKAEKYSFAADADAVRRAKYHAVAERELPTVWRICVLRLAGFERSSIEDVVQEVFVRWLDAMPEFSSVEHEKAWFIKVACNLCADVYRDATRRVSVPLDECEYLTGGDAAEATIAEREILKEILTLPESCRDVVYLYYAEGYNTSEIAKLLGRKPNTVRRELARGRERLKEKLKGEW